MIWETIIVCMTVVILFGDYMKERARRLGIENDKLDHDNLIE